MDDNTRAALDTETPVNPYSLLDALNTAAARSTVVWLAFLALLAYLALAAGSVTHRDLLLDSGVALPLLQTRIDLAHFFVVGAALLALLHVAVVVHLALLARKAQEFHGAVRLLESTDLRTHPLRLELDNFFFVQAIAGPERSRVVGAFLHAIGWLTLLVLPLALLLYLQIAYLPVHDAAVTMVLRVIVLADIVLVLLAGVFLMRAETSFFGAVLRVGLHNPGGVVFGLAVLAGAAFVALAAATVPNTAAADRAVLGIFPRSLNVADAGLVPEAGADKGGASRSISLRGRDLRFARLDRVDLRQADLTGANLDGASLTGADLRGIRLGCADGAPLAQSESRQKGDCATARGANFSGARLTGARLAGADLRAAKLDDAVLDGADLSRALLAGAVLDRARLRRADLSSAVLTGASLLSASLQGAVLDGARLEMADLSGAGLQGTHLISAQLGGAVLRDADLEGAVLQQARLIGADLRGGRLQAADLAGALVWQTAPPGIDAINLADVANIAIKAPGRDELEALKAAARAAEGAPAGGEGGAGAVSPLKELGPDSGWAASADGQAWISLLKASEAAMAEGFKARLGEHLGRMACRTRFADGAVADAIVRRALSPGFKGEPGALYDRLKAGDCAAKAVAPLPLLDLAAAAEAAKPPPAQPQ